jgi:hypothetical protein
MRNEVFPSGKAADCIGAAQGPLQAARNFHNQFISRLVSQTFIDDLKVIYVQVEQGAKISRVALGSL